MQIVRLFVLVATLLLATSSGASAVTPDELAALAKAGLGDEVLLALIESTGMDRGVDAARSLALKRAGVSDRVIAAAVRASYQPPPLPMADPVAAAPCVECEANVAVIGGGPPPPAVVEREVYYLPWILGAPVRQAHARRSGPYLPGNTGGFGRFINDGFVDRTPRRR
jgi:hypothetical protein